MAVNKMRMGKMQCPNCLGDVPSAAKACRHCGTSFPIEQLEKQAAFEARINKASPIVGVGLVTLALMICTFAYHEMTRPLTPGEDMAKAEAASLKDIAKAEAANLKIDDAAKLLARASAGAALMERMKNPSSFELVEDEASPARMDNGAPGWLVAVTYRGSNSFGAVNTQRAIVWVDVTGNKPMKVVDIK